MSDDESKRFLPARRDQKQDRKPVKGELIPADKSGSPKTGAPKEQPGPDSKLERDPLRGDVVQEEKAELGPARRGPAQQIRLPGVEPDSIWQRIMDFIPYSHLALIPIIIMMLIPAFSTLSRSFGSMFYDYQLDREEAFLIQQAIDLSSFESIYKPIDEAPWLVGNYPPVYPAIVGFMGWIFPTNLALGRFVILLGVLLIAASLAVMIVRETLAILPAILAILLFMGTYDFCNWVAFARVDIPAIAFSVAGLAAVTSRQRWPGMLIGCAFFVLAFYTKQTQIAAPAAAYLGLMVQGEKKLANIMAAITGGAIIGLFIFGNTVTDGELYRHLIAYNKNEMNWITLKGYATHLWFFQRFLFIAVIAAFAGAYLLNRFHPMSIFEIDLDNHRPRSRALPIATFYALITAMTFITAAKAGSALNYFLEIHVAIALFASIVFGLMTHELQNLAAREKPWVISAIVVVTLLFYGHALHLIFPRRGVDTVTPVTVFQGIPNDESLYASMELAVKDAPPGKVLLEEPIFAMLDNREVFYQPFIMTQLSREDKWDQTPLLDMINDREFKLISTVDEITEETGSMPGFTEEMQSSIFTHYDFSGQIGKYFLYTPKSVPSP